MCPEANLIFDLSDSLFECPFFLESICCTSAINLKQFYKKELLVDLEDKLKRFLKLKKDTIVDLKFAYSIDCLCTGHLHTRTMSEDYEFMAACTGTHIKNL